MESQTNAPVDITKTPMNHCWKDYRTHLEEIGQIYSTEWVDTYLSGNMTCMAEAGHEDDHDFVEDDSITVALVGGNA